MRFHHFFRTEKKYTKNRGGTKRKSVTFTCRSRQISLAGKNKRHKHEFVIFPMESVKKSAKFRATIVTFLVTSIDLHEFGVDLTLQTLFPVFVQKIEMQFKKAAPLVNAPYLKRIQLP